MNTERIDRISRELMQSPCVLEGVAPFSTPSAPYEGREAFHETWMAHADKPYDVRLARARAAWRSSVRPRIEQDYLIVGEMLPPAIITCPTGVFAWDFQIDRSLMDRHPAGKEIVAYWEDFLARREPLGDRFPQASNAFHMTYSMTMPGGHSVQDYGIAIENGMNGIREQVRRCRGQHPESQDWYDAVMISLDGACAYMQAHADAYMKAAADCTDPARAHEYALIAANCTHLAAGHAPDTFMQACQLFWFLFYLNGHDSPGRIDQYLAPPLHRELERGSLTLEAAQEITDCLYLKMAKHIAYGSTIGGQTPEGTDATNRMTWLCLSSIRRLRLLSPRTALRVHKNTPPELLLEATLTSAEGATFPTFVNDEVMIPSMIRRGATERDALDYTFCGCGQVIPNGRAQGGYEDAVLNMPKALTFTLHRGRDELTGEQLGLDTGAVSAFATYEALEAAVFRQISYMLELVVKESICGKIWAARYLPDFLRSTLTHSCLERGRDFRRGGPDYHDGLIDALGLPTLSDSLAAIRHVVYGQKRCTLEELTAACDANWAGHEALRRACLEAPKFGNDDDRADDIMVRLMHHITDDLFARRTLQGGRWGIDVVGWSGAILHGAATGATPDGRGTGDALADCAGPAQGMDKQGITAVLRSMGKLPTRKVHGPLALSAKFSPQTVGGENAQKLADLITAYFAMGGMQLQPSVVSGEELRQAQREPETWRHLIVRVGGFSARFVDLTEPFQTDMIRRTENSIF